MQKKVRLDNSMLLDSGVYISCCKKRHIINSNDSDHNTSWTCDICGKPLILLSDGIMYYVGNRVFERGDQHG